MMRGCFLRPLLQPACGLIATTMSADSSSPSPAPASADAAATGAGRARRGGKRQRPRNPAPAATTPDAAPGVAKAPRTPHPVLEQLAGLYPHLFGAVFRPLKRGIFQDLLAAHPDAFEREALKVALGIHTRSTRYLQAVASGAARHDLQGQAVEPMAPEHVLHAVLEVFKRRKPRPGETVEQQQQRLQRRIAQIFSDSGLTREALLERANIKEPTALATLTAALDYAAEQDARAEAVQRSFAASGAASPAAFAQMYGMHPKAVERQLARAAQLQALRSA